MDVDEFQQLWYWYFILASGLDNSDSNSEPNYNCHHHHYYHEYHFFFAGNAGRPIEVISNYFKLQSQPDWHLYQYHVDFNPEVDSKRIRQAMMWEQRALLGEVKVFDGMIMFLQKKLPQKVRFYFLVSSAASDSAGPATLPVPAM